MTFNQQLIEKARKGEIAILNDGSVEELRAVTGEIARRIGSTDHKYIILTPGGHWECSTHLQKNIIARPVRDFFLEEIEIPGSISMNADDLIGNLESNPHTRAMTEAIKAWIDGRGKEYSEDFPKMESFRDGLTKGIEISVGFAEWVEDLYIQDFKGKWYLYEDFPGRDYNKVEFLTTSQLLEKYLNQLEK